MIQLPFATKHGKPQALCPEAALRRILKGLITVLAVRMILGSLLLD